MAVQESKVLATFHGDESFPIEWAEAASRDTLLTGLSGADTVFHWHGETFDLPRDAELLASSEACRTRLTASVLTRRSRRATSGRRASPTPVSCTTTHHRTASRSPPRAIPIRPASGSEGCEGP